jgi:fumarate reductase subunit C
MHSGVRQRAVAYPWRQPGDWWLKNPRYLKYMLRELTAVFAALWVVLFLIQIPQMASGPEANMMWRESIRSPGWIIFSLISLAFVLYHAWTAFTSFGTLIYLRMGKTATPGNALNATMMIAWAVVTLVLAFLIVSPGLGR